MGTREFRSLGRLRELQFPESLSLSVRRHGVLLIFLAGVLAAGLTDAYQLLLKAGEHVVSE